MRREGEQRGREAALTQSLTSFGAFGRVGKSSALKICVLATVPDLVLFLTGAGLPDTGVEVLWLPLLA